MNLMNIFGGDWNAGMMQGFQMAALMDQRQLQQQQFQRQMANDAMLNEERRLKIEEHRRQLENRNKLIDQFRPQISKKTWEQPDIETGQSSTMTNTSVSTSPLFQAIANMYGPDKASLIGSLMEVDPEAGMSALKSLKPEEGYLTAGDRVFRKTPAGLQEIVGSSKAPTTRQMNIGGEDVTQQWNPEKGSWDEIARGPKWNPEKAGRETPEESANKVVARLKAKVDAFRQIMGREPTTQEKRAMMINDPYGILGGEEGGGTPATTSTPGGKDKFGYTIGETRKGYRYIGNDQWQKL